MSGNRHPLYRLSSVPRDHGLVHLTNKILQPHEGEEVAGAGVLAEVKSYEQLHRSCPCRVFAANHGSKTEYHDLVAVGVLGLGRDRPCLVAYSKFAGAFLQVNLASGRVWMWPVPLQREEMAHLLLAPRIIETFLKPQGSLGEEDVACCRYNGVPIFRLNGISTSVTKLVFRINQEVINAGWSSRQDSLHGAYIIDLLRRGAGHDRTNFPSAELQHKVLAFIRMSEAELIEYQATQLKGDKQERFRAALRRTPDLERGHGYAAVDASPHNMPAVGNKRPFVAGEAEDGPAKAAKAKAHPVLPCLTNSSSRSLAHKPPRPSSSSSSLGLPPRHSSHSSSSTSFLSPDSNSSLGKKLPHPSGSSSSHSILNMASCRPFLRPMPSLPATNPGQLNTNPGLPDFFAVPQASGSHQAELASIGVLQRMHGVPSGSPGLVPLHGAASSDRGILLLAEAAETLQAATAEPAAAATGQPVGEVAAAAAAPAAAVLDTIEATPAIEAPLLLPPAAAAAAPNAAGSAALVSAYAALQQLLATAGPAAFCEMLTSDGKAAILAAAGMLLQDGAGPQPK